MPYCSEKLLGNVIETWATKFSVKGMDLYSIVHISFYLGKCMATCLHGICASLYKTHNKVPKIISINNKSKCCSHLNTMYDNIEYVKSFFPHYFKQNTYEMNDVPPVPPQEEVKQAQTFWQHDGSWNNFCNSTEKWYCNINQHWCWYGTIQRVTSEAMCWWKSLHMWWGICWRSVCWNLYHLLKNGTNQM